MTLIICRLLAAHQENSSTIAIYPT